MSAVVELSMKDWIAVNKNAKQIETFLLLAFPQQHVAAPPTACKVRSVVSELGAGLRGGSRCIS